VRSGEKGEIEVAEIGAQTGPQLSDAVRVLGDMYLEPSFSCRSFRNCSADHALGGGRSSTSAPQ
jgi:hypothetical protein